MPRKALLTNSIHNTLIISTIPPLILLTNFQITCTFRSIVVILHRNLNQHKLLQQIEELTLYILQQEERIKALEGK